MSALAALAAAAPNAETATTATARFAPVADAYVDQAAPRTRFGGATELRLGAAPGELRSYLRFDVRGLQGTVVRATLRLSPNTLSVPSFNARSVASNSWKETHINWANAPSMGAPIAASTVGADGSATLDVTPLVSGAGLVSVGLTTTSATRISLASREATMRAPELVVETDPGSADTVPPAVTLTQPPNGSATSDATPTFSGVAGNAEGDSATVTVKVYSGTAASGAPVQTLSTTRSGNGWSVDASSALAPGTYTAQAEQSDAAGNTGRSAPSTFSVASETPPGSYGDLVMSDSPRAYWRLGESSGTQAVDSTTNNNTGSYLNGVVLGRPGAIASDPNTSISLDGANDNVRVPSAANLNATGALSVEAWVKPSSLPGSTATILRKDLQYLLRLTSTGNVIFRLWKSGSEKELSTGPNLVRAGVWNHVVATWDGAAMRIYVGGTERASLSLAAPIDSGTSALHIGASAGSYDWFAGQVDEVAVYGSALDASRVAERYRHGNTEGAGGPTVALDSPAAGSTMDATPTFGGSGGTAAGDLRSVTVKVYAGGAASGTPVQTLSAAVQSAGTFSVKAAPLASGTYTAQAEQSDDAGRLGRSSANTFTVDASADPTIVAAGDIAACDTFGDEATAKLLDGLPGTVVPLGDLAYEFATASDFANCYDPTWGRHKARTRPVPGSHDYAEFQNNGEPYYGYFGSAAGDPAKGYYSYDVGSWHVIALNSNCSKVGGCGAGSPQERWLRADLAASTAACTLAYWHDARFSSGNLHGSNSAVQAFWQALYDYGAEVVLNGHEHVYERFAPQTPTGAADALRGIRQFTVGTGGRSHYSFGRLLANSEVQNADTFGVLTLKLGSAGYSWRFAPEAGRVFTDSGSAPCR